MKRSPTQLWGGTLGRLLFAACCMLLLSDCAHRIYPDRLPQGFNGHPWHESLYKFTGLESFSESSWSASCYLPLASQISGYIQTHETYTIAGIRPVRVEYYFYYRGLMPRFGGSLVTFQSEEFDLDQYPNTAVGKSTYEQIRGALVKEYGPPHRGEIPRAAIKVTTLDGLVVPSIFKAERYSWCGLGDPHAPRNCKLTVVLVFEPLLGMGWIFYATPELRDTLLEGQAYYPYPDDLYLLLYFFQLPTAMPLPLDCEMDAALNRHNPFRVVPPDPEHDDSERLLDSVAYENGEIRPPPVRHLSLLETFTELQRVEEELDHARGDAGRTNYLIGYGQGIRYRYYADRYLTTEVHQRWLKAKDASQPAVRIFSQGYQDALKRESKPNAPTPSVVLKPLTLDDLQEVGVPH